jgi:hypothetical protein
MVAPKPPSTPGSRAARLAACNSIAAPGSIAARAAHNATLDNTFAINPTIDEIQYKDDVDAEDKNGNNDADTTVQGNGDSEDDGDGCNDEDNANYKVNVDGNDKDEHEEEGNENKSDDEDDDDEFYKSSLFNDDDDDSIDDAAYCVPSAKGAGTSCKANPGHPEKPNTDGMSQKEAEEALRKLQKSWKHETDKDRRKSAHGATTDETIIYTGVVSDLL